MSNQRFLRSALPLAAVLIFLVLIATPRHIYLGFNQKAAVLKTNKRKGEELPSGWDLRARELYNAARRNITNAVYSDPANVIVYTTVPVGPVKSHAASGVYGGEWLKGNIDGIPVWEPDTFKSFLTHVPYHDVYVDFGTWIGPTLFFAAQMTGSAFGIEADPVAYASVSATLHLNREKPWFRKVRIQPAGVGPGSSDMLIPTEVSMMSASPGNSCSGMGSTVNSCSGGEVLDKWRVNTYPLPALLKHWGVADGSVFVKVDVESFECTLVPSWIPWLSTLDTKPTFLISFHSYVTACTENEYQLILKFAKLFRSALLANGESVRIENSFDDLKGETLLLSDRDHV